MKELLLKMWQGRWPIDFEAIQRNEEEVREMQQMIIANIFNENQGTEDTG